MNKTENNDYLYAWEGIACIAVMMFHCPLPGEAGLFLRAMARFTVPLFFAVSGKYLMQQWKEAEASNATALRGMVCVRLWRTLRVAMFVLAVHTAYSLVWYLVRGETFFSWLSMKYAPAQWIRLVFFNTGNVIFDGSVGYDHLWYLFALVYVFIVLYVFGAWLLSRARIVAPVMLLLLYAGLHLRLRVQFTTAVVPTSDWFLLRNWLFTGLPFVLLGAALYNIHLGRKGLWLALAGLLLAAVEYRFFGERELYAGSLFTVIGALCGDGPFWRTGAYIGQHLSRHVYYWHLLVYSALIWVLWILPGDLHAQPATAWVLPVGTYAMTLIMAQVIYKTQAIIMSGTVSQNGGGS